MSQGATKMGVADAGLAASAPRPFGAVVVCVVLPCYGVERHIQAVVQSMPPWVDHIVAVNDASKDGTADVLTRIADPRLVVLHHTQNRGVGGATQTGFAHALQLGADIVVKMDGDGQMDPDRLEALVGPVARGTADFAKGNRWADLKALKTMPPLRLAGNTVLGFLVRAASGYWSTFDPVNGFLAVRTDLLRLFQSSLPERYFFECGLLIEAGIQRAVVVDVPMPARYGDERSSLSIPRTVVGFPPRLLRGFLRRVFWRYYIYDFSVVSLLLAAGLPMFLFGLVFGSWAWAQHAGTEYVSAGQVMLAAMPIILGFQLLLQACVLDIANTPRTPVTRPLRSGN